MRRLLHTLLISTIVFALSLQSSGFFALQKKKRLILATATTGGTYYPVGVGIATLVTNTLEDLEGITMSAITSAGSGENIQLLRNKEAELAIIQSLWGSMAWQGKGRYKDRPVKFIRSVTRLWENVEHFALLKKYAPTGNILDLKNIKKKSFSIGARGSGTEMSGRVILEALGFDSKKDFRLQYLGYNPSAEALQNGRVVGMNIPAGPPASAITQAFAAIGADDMCLLEFTEEQCTAINGRFPVWNSFVIEEGTYPGQKKPIRTISQSNVLVVHRDVEAEVVYAILKTVYENLDYLKTIHQSAGEISLEKALAGLSTPLHPGAVRFYQEKGIEIPVLLLADWALPEP